MSTISRYFPHPFFLWFQCKEAPNILCWGPLLLHYCNLIMKYFSQFQYSSIERRLSTLLSFQQCL